VKLSGDGRKPEGEERERRENKRTREGE